jgi:uncharacterized protein involved in outer membrane biogenesis
MSVAIGDARIDGISGDVDLAPAGVTERIRLRNADGSLTIEVLPKAGSYKIAVSAKGWKMPASPNLALDYLEARGDLGNSRIELSSIEGRLYQGLISGTGAIDWSDGAVMDFDIQFQRVNLAKLLPALGAEITGEGDVSGKIRLKSTAGSLGALTTGLKADASFELKRGSVGGFDLAAVVHSVGRVPTRGGVTTFEQFSGKLKFEQDSYRLSNLHMGSGLMKAGGYLNIDANKRLKGALVVEVKGSAAWIKVPVAIGGTTSEPLLTPTRSTRGG